MRVMFTFPAGTSMPDAGDEIAAPVEGGREWLTLGTVRSVMRRHDGSKAMLVDLPAGVEARVEP